MTLQATPRTRTHPFDRIRRSLATTLPETMVSELPRKWELLGDVLVLRLPPELVPEGQRIARAYAAELGARTVLQDVGGVGGELREPKMRLLAGDRTETTHTEDGLRYTFDASRIMWASGNHPERMRMGRVVRPGEVVADLFAGIGYFAIPMARAGATVLACEKNPLAHRYLVRNAAQNRLAQLIDARLGDCRDVAPVGVCSRVVMGYIGETTRYLPTAFAALASEGGTVHMHDACPLEEVERGPVAAIRQAAAQAHREVDGIAVRIVKSYAPGIVHFVAEANVR